MVNNKWIFVLLIIVGLTGCSTNQQFSTQSDIQSDSELLKESETSAKRIELHELVSDESYEFSVEGYQIAQEIKPSNAVEGESFLYYKAEDEGQIFVDVIFQFKNLKTEALYDDEVMSVELIYDDQYRYITFEVYEERENKDFTYSGIKPVMPLQSIQVHHLGSLPEEVEHSEKPLKARITIEEMIYEIELR